MWQKFSHIFCHDKKVKHVVSYIISKQVYWYTWHKWRSPNLIKHKCKIGQSTITSFISVKLKIKKKTEVSSDLKLLATKQLVKFVSKVITPSTIAAGDGFIQMAWLLIRVRAKHGAVSAATSPNKYIMEVK